MSFAYWYYFILHFPPALIVSILTRVLSQHLLNLLIIYFSGNYDQLDDELSADPLRVTLFDADEKKIWSSPLGAPEGTFSVTTTGGRNMLCITNGIDYDDDTGNEDDRTVGFAVRVRPATVRAQEENVEGPDTRVMTNLIEMSEEIGRAHV